jgi:predicted DNA-binding transcriptional regulator AlpA
MNLFAGYMTTKQAAEFVNLSEQHLKRLNREGKGPRRVRLGRANYYNPQDLADWAVSRARVTDAGKRYSDTHTA